MWNGLSSVSTALRWSARFRFVVEPVLSAAQPAPCLGRRQDRGWVVRSRIDVVDRVATPEASLTWTSRSG